MRLLIAIIFLIATSASAETYIQINGVSLHDKPGYNQFNYGAGVEQTITENWSVAGGWYRNSEYRGSAYGYARYSVYKDGHWDLGIGAGLVTGYNTYKITPMAFPEVCYSYVCAIALPQVEPSGASVLGFHLRVSI